MSRNTTSHAVPTARAKTRTRSATVAVILADLRLVALLCVLMRKMALSRMIASGRS